MKTPSPTRNPTVGDVLLRLVLAAATATALTALRCPANAQMPGAGNPAVQAAIANCKADRQKFCADVTPGGGRILKCLTQNADALTPACRTALNDARAATAPGASAAPK